MRRLRASLLAFLLAAGGLAAAAQTPPAVTPSTSLAPPPDAPPPKPQPPGPYPVSIVAEPTLMTHTVYRPTDLRPFTPGKRLPIVVWGNGACSNAGLLFQTFLTQIASQGYLVIASGPKDAPLPAFATARPGQSGAPAPQPGAAIPAAVTKDEDLLKAIDWATKQSMDKSSPYYNRLNPNEVAVMGQSCGGLQAIAVSGDPRVKTTVIWNSGVFREGTAPALKMSGATKDSIKKFHAPVAYFLGGPSDLAYANGKDDFSRIPTPGVPAFLGSIHVGHGGTYNQPGGGRFGEVGVAWLNWRLKDDKASARYFQGADCFLCKNPIWEVDKKNMR
ncbi:MAG: alpha/beta hydrolase [Alphaproteobacteria bacterium]|nr:alpha/beta hydrolase [Alphaproteobacteria bacterium]